MNLTLWRSFIDSIPEDRCFMCGAANPTKEMCCCPTHLTALMGDRWCVPAIEVAVCSDCHAPSIHRRPWWAVERWLRGGEQLSLFGASP